MSDYNIRTAYRERVTSNGLNEKIATLVGGNRVISGFNSTLINGNVSISNGECVIEGACITSKFNTPKIIQIPKSYSTTTNLWICLQYNHLTATIKEVITNENPESKFTLVLCNLRKSGEGYIITKLNRMNSLSNSSNKINRLEYDFNELQTIYENQIKNSSISNPSNMETVDARGHHETLKTRLDSMDSNVDNQLDPIRSDLADSKNKIIELGEMNPIWNSHEGTGTVLYTNSIEAFTKDLAIKGKTIGGYNSETGESDNIVSSGEAEGNKIIVKSIGKNLFNPKYSQKISDPSIIFSGNTVEFVQGEAEFILLDKFKKNTSYSINFEKISGPCIFSVLYDDGTYTHITSSFTSSSNKSIKLIERVWGYEVVSVVKNIMINEGTIATQYESYQEDRKEVIIPYSGGLRGLVTVQDELKSEEGKIVQKLKEKIFDSTELWVLGGANPNTLVFAIGGWSSSNNAKVQGDLKSNHFGKSKGTTIDEEGIIIGGSLNVLVNKTSLETQDVNGFKKLLQKWNIEGNPLKLIYELTTPTIHNIEKMPLDTYSGITHISQENNIKGEITLQAPGNKDASIISLKNKIDIVEENFDSQLAQMLLDMLKKDGSVEMSETLNILGDWKGVTITTSDGSKVHFGSRTAGMGGFTVKDTQGNASDVAMFDKDRFSPFGKTISLGDPINTWKDIWVGGSSREATGYSKETNGIIRQWGQYTFNPGTTSVEIALPTTFPNSCDHPRVTFTHSDGSSVTMGQVPGGIKIDNSKIKIGRNSSSNYCAVLWEVLGW